MPEGDTIHRAAARLRPVLAGKRVASFRAPRLGQPGPEAGTVITDVRARGKFLLVDFADGLTLETHLKMAGSWHLYRTGERWRRSPGAARAVIETDEGWSAVCFAAPHVRLVRAREPVATAYLGPDLASPAPDLDEAVRRFSLLDGATALVDVLLDQRICAGVGNVYKSEVLFACGLHPQRPVGSVDQTARRLVVETAHHQLRRNLGGGARRTVPAGLAVYGRRGRPCRRCGTTVESARLGRHARSTYWCPSCQPAFGGGDETDGDARAGSRSLEA